MNKKAIIFGIKGYKLSKKERNFLSKTKPWGIILFSRNVKNISQLKKLTDELRSKKKLDWQDKKDIEKSLDQHNEVKNH